MPLDRPAAVLPGAAAAPAGDAGPDRPAALAGHRRGPPPAAGRLGAGGRGAAAAICTASLFITVHPDQVAAGGARRRRHGPRRRADARRRRSRQFCAAIGATSRRRCADATLDAGRGAGLAARPGKAPFRVRVAPGRTPSAAATRRKYAEGDLPPDRSFYFRGPEGKLNLRAQNLILFLQLADGVDDDDLAAPPAPGRLLALVPRADQGRRSGGRGRRGRGGPGVAPAESRRRIRQAVEAEYTLPATAPLPLPGTNAAPCILEEGRSCPRRPRRPIRCRCRPRTSPAPGPVPPPDEPPPPPGEPEPGVADPRPPYPRGYDPLPAPDQ